MRPRIIKVNRRSLHGEVNAELQLMATEPPPTTFVPALTYRPGLPGNWKHHVLCPGCSRDNKKRTHHRWIDFKSTGNKTRRCPKGQLLYLM